MKDKILEIINQNCKDEKYELNTALYISGELKRSRNEIAKYLQELVAEELCIKIEKRPAFYVSRQGIETKYQLKIMQHSYKSMEQLLAVNKVDSHDFHKLIGYNGSLKDLVNQCKATVGYPPKGLPMLLYGPTGTGKSYIARLTYEYALNKGIISEGKFITINCSEYANNPELLTANLFGYVKGAFTGADKDKEGLIALADGGILFLDEVHNLNAECQEKLFQFMDQSIYHRVGDNEKWYKSNVRLMFATTEVPEKVLLKTLLRRIPMIMTVPSLKERGKQEMMELIVTMFQKEEKRIEKKIKINGKVMQALLSYDFTGNIGELKSCIQFCCVNAFFKSAAETVHISLETLPKKMLDNIKEKQYIYQASQDYFDISGYKENYQSDFIELNEELLRKYREYINNIVDEQLYIHSSQEIIWRYFDRLLLKKQHILDFYVQGFQHIVELVANRYGFILTNNDILSLIQCIYVYHQDFYNFKEWHIHQQEVIDELYFYIKNKFYQEYCIVKEIQAYVQSYLNVDIMTMVMIVFILYLKNIDKSEWKQKRMALILAHGFSTASSIADAINKFFGKHVFDAIDMPIYVDINEIIYQVHNYIKKLEGIEELLLLVDMGSLEEIYKGIHIPNINIGILNNISTKIALEVGNGLLQNQSMEDIFQTVMKYNVSKYHIVRNRKKEHVILCSCASGLGTAKKLKEMIQLSIPNKVNIKVKTFHYQELLDQSKIQQLLNDMHILCVIGTLNPNIPHLNFIPIEDFIMNDHVDELDNYLKDYMSQEDFMLFKKNIVKNFSLTNIMNTLTILNPNKLLEHVADAIDRLQTIMRKQFSNHTCFGLYVHISCLIERLVLQKGIESYPNIEDFQEKQKAFINYVKQAFDKVEQFYSVEIPIEEVGYLFDYVIKDERMISQGNEDF